MIHKYSLLLSKYKPVQSSIEEVLKSTKEGKNKSAKSYKVFIMSNMYLHTCMNCKLGMNDYA